MFGRLETEGVFTIHVRLMAMPPVFTPLPWDRLTRQEDKQPMMKVVLQKWQSRIASIHRTPQLHRWYVGLSISMDKVRHDGDLAEMFRNK